MMTKAEFAKLCGVSKPAVTNACKRKLRAAVVDNQIDETHKAALDYRKKPRRVPNPGGRDGRSSSKPGPKTEPKLEGLEGLPKDIRDLVDWPLRDLVEMFGTDIAFIEWLNATQKIEKIHEARLKNETREGVLVDRDLVRKGVLDPLDTAHKKLLTDGSRTISRRVFAMAESGRSIEECETYVRESISKFLQGAKDKARRAIEKGV